MSKIANSVEAISRGGAGVARGGPAATATARAAPPVAAGDDDRIPRVFLGAGDLLVLVLAFLAAHYFAPAVQGLLLPGGLLPLPAIFPAPQAPTPDLFRPLSEVIWLLMATAPATFVALELLGGYRRLITQSITRLVASATISQTVAISFGALIGFALKLPSSSRVLIFTYGLASSLGLIAYRAAVWTYQERRLANGVYAKNVLLVGQPRTVEWMIQHFRKHVAENRFRLAGWLSVHAEQAHFPERRRDDASRDIPLERLGRAEDLGELLIHHPVHEVIAIQSSGDREWLRHVLEHCDYFRIRLRIVPEALLVETLRDLRLVFRDDPLRLPEVVLAPPHLDADVLFVKRFIDIVVSAALLVILSPLFLLVAAAIKITTPHLPVFYPWRVIGLSGRPFTGHKFTTMVADADELKQRLLARNEMKGPVFKLKEDPRITPLGGFLRKFSLNELPQLWSVLKGDMSLVGPRPAFRDELERYELWQKRKLCVKPGLTCLWQVSGRNRINSFDDWVRLDLEYIDRWSLWLDMRILARTLWAVVSGSGS
ncbi:MAG: sugar transferase [Acidobacteria bacterium]|nr:sugar transferase [Acidobacteriota bacterium]